jgi:hypothetical protein
LDQVEVLGGNTGLAGSFVVEELDLLEETGFAVLIETGAGGCVDSRAAEVPQGN